jgi:hypothetical protein
VSDLHESAALPLRWTGVYGPRVACNLVKGHATFSNHGLYSGVIACYGFCLQAVVWGGQRLTIQTLKLQHART